VVESVLHGDGLGLSTVLRSAGSRTHAAFPFDPETIQFSCKNYCIFTKKTKTYGRFLGMIFFGGFRSAQIPAGQRLAEEKITKK
jgi:hypothetical protein